MSDKKLHWNKSILYYDLPLLIQTNLKNDELEFINTNYNFLLSPTPVFQLFYTEYNENHQIYNICYFNYSVTIQEKSTLEELLKETIFKENIITDKKISVVHAIKKHSNYYSIRYVDVYLKHLNGNLTVNDKNKKSFKQFVHDFKTIDKDIILSEEI